MKKQRKKLALETFKIAKLITNYSFIIGGSRSGHNTIDATNRPISGPATSTISDNPTTKDPQNSTFLCTDVEELTTYSDC